MAAALWKNRAFAGFSGFGSKTDSSALDAALKRATHSEKVDVEKDALLAIAQSCHHADDRRTIMIHLQACLNDTASAKWRVVNAALTVVDHILKNGSPELVSETAAGMHFDLAQRLWFLEKFEYSFDKRVETMIRRKALSLRGYFLEKQQQAVALESEVVEQKPRVFHTDDTDDDLSDNEAERSKGPPRHSDNLLEESTTDGEFMGVESDSSPRMNPKEMDLLEVDSRTAGSKTISDKLDLLDLGGDSLAPAQVTSAANESSLLDLM